MTLNSPEAWNVELTSTPTQRDTGSVHAVGAFSEYDNCQYPIKKVSCSFLKVICWESHCAHISVSPYSDFESFHIMKHSHRRPSFLDPSWMCVVTVESRLTVYTSRPAIWCYEMNCRSRSTTREKLGSKQSSQPWFFSSLCLQRLIDIFCFRDDAVWLLFNSRIGLSFLSFPLCGLPRSWTLSNQKKTYGKLHFTQVSAALGAFGMLVLSLVESVNN